MAQNISMTQIPPQGELKIYHDIEIGSGRQKIFRTKAEQQAYFNNHLVMSFSDMSYIRMGRGIQIESDTVSIANCDYISFKNKAVTGFEDEIYASIDPNWEYVNPSTVKINYTIDWWQTCMHSGIVFKEGVVRREHMNETDWTAAVANPYADIFQLQTSEELPMDESMERLADANTGDVSIFPSLPQHATGDTVQTDDMRLMLILGQTDFSEVQSPPNMSIPSGINPMTWIIGQIGSSGGSAEKGTTIQGIPNACTIFVMKYNPSDDPTTVTTFNNLLNILEFNAITGNIVGLYWIPKEYADNLSEYYKRAQISAVPYQYAPRNPKLYRAPYCYLRVSDETGQYKHYEWENFSNLISDGATSKYVKFDVFFSKVGMPVLFAAPRQYKTILASSVYDDDEMLFTNVEEALVHEDIPYLPYSTDGYVSALGSKFRESWSSVNPIKNSMLNSMTSGISKMSWVNGAVESVLLHPSQTLNDIMNYGQGGKEVWYDRIKALAEKDMEYDKPKKNKPTNWLAGIGNNLAKANVADNYNVGSSKGWAGYMRAPLRFIFQKVCPRADIVEQYDKYFDYFGYNSGRIGVPYVYNYIKRTGDQPHFATIDGEQVTYCQADITVMANGKAPEVAARAIEAMFSSGMIFTK